MYAMGVASSGERTQVETWVRQYPEVAAELAAIEKDLYGQIEPILKDRTLHHNTTSLETLKSYYYKKKYIQRILARLGD